jgi:hypothetical protein
MLESNSRAPPSRDEVEEILERALTFVKLLKKVQISESTQTHTSTAASIPVAHALPISTALPKFDEILRPPKRRLEDVEEEGLEEAEKLQDVSILTFCDDSF